MHEYPLTMQIIQTAEEYAKKHGANSVKAIHLTVGEASGCVADCITLYFDLIAVGTLCAEAELAIEQVKPKLRCKRCGSLFERAPFSFSCPVKDCKGDGEPTEIGREFRIEFIEVE